MPTIDLTAVPLRAAATLPPASPSIPSIDAAPRRIGLTLTELQYAARLAGDAPLPFDVAAPTTTDAMQARLGQSREATDDQSYRSAIAGLHPAEASLERRGLVVGGVADPGLVGAIGLLAAPQVAVDIDLAVDTDQGTLQGKVWHRQAGPAVASLATADGIAFELAWFATEAWPGELARVGVASEDIALGDSAVPAFLDLPYELADAATEAGRVGRSDLLPVLAARHSGATLGPDGPLTDDEVARALAALSSEARGRLRALVARIDTGQADSQVETVGIVSWSLLADGWRSLRPHRDGDLLRVEVTTVTPADLAGLVAPVLATVTSGGTR